MKLKIKDPIQVQCPECNLDFTISQDKFKYKIDAVDERSMGTEYEHSFICNGVCECGKHFYIKYYQWEYPKDMLNYFDKETNMVLLNEFQIEQI